MQWFRFYTEAVSDKKLRRIARDNGESMAHVLGVWTIVLSIASDSPVRGQLLISDDVPATIDDISDAAGCNVTATFRKLLVTGLVTERVTDSGAIVYEVPAWDRRQFESDSSATRVRKHRERKKAAEKPENVTLQQRFGNAPDTDTDTDTELKPLTAPGGELPAFPDRRVTYAHHVSEAKKAGVDAPTFTAIVDRLVDAAGWRALVDAAQDDRKLTQAKDGALALVRMGYKDADHVGQLLDAYATANDWRKTPPTPQVVAEYGSQMAGKLKPKTTRFAWVLDSNGNRIEKVQVTA